MGDLLFQTFFHIPARTRTIYKSLDTHTYTKQRNILLEWKDEHIFAIIFLTKEKRKQQTFHTTNACVNI